MKKVFVTGINGLLGTNLTENLLIHDFVVKGLIRDKTKFTGPAHKNLELIQGNLFDDLTPFLKDVDIVIHVAAETSQNLAAYDKYKTINYETTKQLFNTAVSCEIKKFVFVSTANTLGFGSLDFLGNELQPMKKPFTNSFYAKSKLEAEEFLLENTHKTDIILLHPTFMIGAYDTKPSSGKIILMGWKKKIVFYPPGGKNFVHVKDVSGAIIKSLTIAENGQKYLIANENLSYLQFFQKLNNIAGQKPIMIKIPKSFLTLLGYFGDLMRLFKIKTNLSSTNMKALCIDNFYCNKKSIHSLNIKYQSINSAINDAVAYFSTQKFN